MQPRQDSKAGKQRLLCRDEKIQRQAITDSKAGNKRLKAGNKTLKGSQKKTTRHASKDSKAGNTQQET